METKFTKFKKYLSCLLVFVLISSIFCGCNRKSAEAEKADELILAIGQVTLDDEPTILAAKVYYDTLTDKQKSQVENYSILESAIITVDSLKKEKEYNALYEQALTYEQTDIVLAYEEFQKLPKEYKDVDVRMSKLEPYVNACGYWEYVGHTGSYAPEFYWAEVNFVESTDDSTKIDVTWYNEGGYKKDVRTFWASLTDNGIIRFQNTIYAATVWGKPNGDLTRKYEINGDVLTFTYIYEESQILGVYTYQKSDAPGK